MSLLAGTGVAMQASFLFIDALQLHSELSGGSRTYAVLTMTLGESIFILFQ